MKKMIPPFFILFFISSHCHAQEALFNTLKKSTGEGTALNACVSGDAESGKTGNLVFSSKDSSGNLITPSLEASTNRHQVSAWLRDINGNGVTSQANGAQRALDVGINVNGSQIDPRTNTVRSTAPSVFTDNTQAIPILSPYGFSPTMSESALLAIWGKMFRSTTNYFNPTGTAEVNNSLFRNPNGSGVNCIIKKLAFSSFSGSGTTIYRIYRGATVTGNGTALSAVGGRTTGQSTAQCVFSKAPTTSASGTIFATRYTTNTSESITEEVNGTIIVEPNTNILFRTQQSLTGQPGNIDIEWSEQP